LPDKFGQCLCHLKSQAIRYPLTLNPKYENTDKHHHIARYKAGPLEGIWATGPCLHNGSVISLYELLLPSTKRTPKFNIGSREFDPKHVGFKNAGDFELNTETRGNFNTGHEYGTQLDPDERWALIEFLKSL